MEKNKITRDNIIKALAKKTMLSVGIVKEVYDALEDVIAEQLSTVTEDNSITLKLFAGITLNGVYVPEHKVRNNNVTSVDMVPSKIKPRFNISKYYIDKLNAM